jgi:hypothetical protein
MPKRLVFSPLPRGFREPLGIQVYVIDRGEWIVIKWFCEHSQERFDLTFSEGLPIFYDYLLRALKKWRGGLTITSADNAAESGIVEEKRSIWPSLIVLETFQKLTRLLEFRLRDASHPPSGAPRFEQY